MKFKEYLSENKKDPLRFSGLNAKTFDELRLIDFIPDTVIGSFMCANNKLVSLKGCPSEIAGDFFCSDNDLTSLEGGPKIVDGCYQARDNQLISLKGVPDTINWLVLSNNKLTSLRGIEKLIKNTTGLAMININNNPIKSHILGLLMIPGLKNVQFHIKDVEEIINKNLGKGRTGVLDAQADLIAAGYPDYAQL